MKSKIILSITFLSLLFSTQLNAITRFHDARIYLRHMLQRHLKQFKKRAACVAGVEGCTQEEITEARIRFWQIISGLILISSSAWLVTNIISEHRIPGAPSTMPVTEQELPMEAEMPPHLLPAIQTSHLSRYDQLVYDQIVGQKWENVEKLLPREEITKHMVDTLKLAVLMAGNRVDKYKAHKLYEILQKLASENKLSFIGENADKDLWDFFKAANVIPMGASTYKSFYRWQLTREEMEPVSFGPYIVKKP